MRTPEKLSAEACSAPSDSGQIWDRDTIAQLRRDGQEIASSIRAQTVKMRTVTSDDLKVRSR